MTGKKQSLEEFMARTKVAGPDSPIYKSGLTMTAIRKPPTPKKPVKKSK